MRILFAVLSMTSLLATAGAQAQEAPTIDLSEPETVAYTPPPIVFTTPPNGQGQMVGLVNLLAETCAAEAVRDPGDLVSKDRTFDVCVRTRSTGVVASLGRGLNECRFFRIPNDEIHSVGAKQTAEFISICVRK